MALNTMEPQKVDQQALEQLEVKCLPHVNLDNLHVVIAVCIDGGPVTQEEQRTVAEIVDEVVFDLRRRGPDWAKDTAIFTVRFPDVQSFVKSLDGERSLVRTDRFKTRQHDIDCGVNKPLAWEVPDPPQQAHARGHSLLRVTYEEALRYQDGYDPKLLWNMCEDGDAAGVQRLITAKCPIDEAKMEDGYNALHACSRNGFDDIAKLILEAYGGQQHQQYVDTTTDEGTTPLHFAAQNGHTECVAALLDAKADANKSDDSGYTPLHVAAQEGHTECVAALLAANVDANRSTKSGTTPLYYAAQNGHTECVEALLAAKADADESDNKRQTPLYHAVLNGQTECVAALLAAKADVHKSNISGETALDVAKRMGRHEIVAIFQNATN